MRSKCLIAIYRKTPSNGYNFSAKNLLFEEEAALWYVAISIYCCGRNCRQRAPQGVAALCGGGVS